MTDACDGCMYVPGAATKNPCIHCWRLKRRDRWMKTGAFCSGCKYEADKNNEDAPVPCKACSENKASFWTPAEEELP